MVGPESSFPILLMRFLCSRKRWTCHRRAPSIRCLLLNHPTLKLTSTGICRMSLIPLSGIRHPRLIRNRTRTKRAANHLLRHQPISPPMNPFSRKPQKSLLGKAATEQNLWLLQGIFRKCLLLSMYWHWENLFPDRPCWKY